MTYRAHNSETDCAPYYIPNHTLKGNEMTRTKRVTVRAYNLRPGDVLASRNNHIVESAVRYPGMWTTEFTDVMYRDEMGTYIVTYNSDANVTVIRNV